MSPDSKTGGALIVQALESAGVRNCFGVPGESFLGVLDALRDSSISFISTRHEGGAAFMASGYSKTVREIGVCLGTRAVGAGGDLRNRRSRQLRTRTRRRCWPSSVR